MKKFLRYFRINPNHSSLILVSLVMGLLCIGLIDHTGFKHLPKILIVISSLFAFYFILYKFKLIEFVSKLSNKISFKYLTTFLKYLPFILCMVLFTVEIFALKGLPGLKLFNIETTREYSALRAGIHQDTFILFKYLSGFLLKAIFPFAILHYLILGERKIYYFLLVIASVYAFSMLQKSYILSMLLPSLLYVIYYRKYLDIFLQAMTIFAVIMSLSAGWLKYNDDVIDEGNTLTQNITGTNIDSASHRMSADSASAKLEKIQPVNEGFISRQWRTVMGISNRIFIVPGEMVSQWFENIPTKLPYLKGDGYPILAKLKGTTPISYELEMYKLLYPEYYRAGFHGSANCATFMREYSNFGIIGLVFSGLFLALTCMLLNILFRGYNLLFYCFNLFPIFFLSSVSLFTSMFSGGWLLLILLFVLYKNIYFRYIDKTPS